MAANIKVVQRRARDIEVGDIVRVRQSHSVPNPLWFEVVKVDVPSEAQNVTRLWRSERSAHRCSPLELVDVQVNA